jgi:uncharacterized protein
MAIASRVRRPYAPLRAAILAVLFCLVSSLAVAGFKYPPLVGRVSDQANIVPAPARAAIETKLKALEDKSGIQLVVATLKSLEGADIETYANGLFRHWKLGEAKNNNGVLFLIAPNERKMRIEVGYGLEGTLTDAISKIIIATTAAPRFKAGDFGGGVERGADAIIEVLSGDASEWSKRAKATPGSELSALDQIMPLVFIALFIFIFIAMAQNARGGSSGGYTARRRGGRGPVIFLPGPSDSSGGSSWGGSSWGGGDSGGFSGGGGSSGGGGASGDW